MKRRFALLLFALLPCLAHAQGTVTLTSNSLRMGGGSMNLPDGSQLCVMTVDSNNRPAGYRIGTAGGQTAAAPGQRECHTVTAGAVQPFTVINSGASSPLNACIRITQELSTGQVVRMDPCVQTGTAASFASGFCIRNSDGSVACNYDQYPIGTAPIAVMQPGIVGPVGPPGCTVGGSCSSDLLPASAGKIIYVYPQSGSDYGTLVNNAFATCGGKVCTVVLAPQQALISYAVPIQIPGAMGQWLDGSANTLGYTGGGDGVVVQPLNSNDPTGGLRNIQFDGTGNTSAANVIHQTDRIAFRYDNVAMRNFVTANALLIENTPVAGTAANAWPLGQTVQGYNERTRVEVSSTNNAKGVVFSRNGGTNSFARTHILATCTLLNNQSCVTITNGAFVYNSLIETNGNGSAGSKFLEVTGGGTLRAAGLLAGEGGGYGYYNDNSFIAFDGDVVFDTGQGNYSSSPSSRTHVSALQGQCFQAGYYNLGVPQARNGKWCLNGASVDYFMAHGYGGEQDSNFTLHTRVTTDADPESDGTGYDSALHADSRGYVSVGPNYEPSGPNSAYNGHMSGQPFEISVPMAQFAPLGNNSAAWHWWYFDATNKRLVHHFRAFDTPGQPSWPMCAEAEDSAGDGTKVLGECETFISHAGSNKKLNGNYDAKSFSVSGTGGWSGSCASPKAVVVTNGIVTGCQ